MLLYQSRLDVARKSSSRSLVVPADAVEEAPMLSYSARRTACSCRPELYVVAHVQLHSGRPHQSSSVQPPRIPLASRQIA